MNKEKMLELQKEYPVILKDLGGDPSKTCMSFEHGGISIGNGWIPLLKSLFRYLQHQHDVNGYPQIIAEQIKEKFGTLRFYYTAIDNTVGHPYPKYKEERLVDTLHGAISFAEVMSESICEECGKPGVLRNDNYWVTVRCDACYAK
jgi:hypothetical protein